MPRKIKLVKVNKRFLHRLESFLNSNSRSYLSARNKLILSLFYYQGLRTSIVQALKVKHYDLKNNILTIPYDYHIDKSINILVENPTAKHLDFIFNLNPDLNDPLFKRFDISKHKILDIALSTRQIQRIVDYTLSKLGFPKNLPPRALRHLCAIRLTKEELKYSSLNKIIGKTSPWAFTDYKRRAGNFHKAGEV